MKPHLYRDKGCWWACDLDGKLWDGKGASDPHAALWLFWLRNNWISRLLPDRWRGKL